MAQRRYDQVAGVRGSWEEEKIKVTPFSLNKSNDSTEIWESWLSKRSNTGISWEDQAYLMKCRANFKKFSSIIHPELFAAPSLPDDAPFKKWSQNLSLGNTKNGRIEFPLAQIPTQTVTNVPRSADVIFPTYLTPRRLTIRLGFWTVVTPVSFIFKIDAGSRRWRYRTFIKLSKNLSTVVGLKLEVLAKLVASGVLIDRVLWHLMKRANQSAPAIFLSHHDLGIREPRTFAYW